MTTQYASRYFVKISAHFMITLIVFFLLQAGTVAAEPWRPAVKTIRVNNYDMAYVERGSGNPLILVHGALSDYRTWLPLMADFSETNRAIAVSLRHYYPEKWDGKGNDLTLQQHADDLAAFINALNLGAVDLLGHSRGAIVTMLVASQHPELINKLVLADPAPLQAMLSQTPNAKKLLEARRSVMQETIQHYQNGKPDDGLQLFVDYIAGPKAWENTSDVRRKTLRDNSWTQVSHLRDFETPFHCDNEKRISSHALLITGERSGPLYGYMLSALQPCFKQVNNASIADAGHMMFSANPTAFVFEVQEFIAPQ